MEINESLAIDWQALKAINIVVNMQAMDACSRIQRKINTGTVLSRSSVVVVLPTIRWRMREWP